MTLWPFFVPEDSIGYVSDRASGNGAFVKVLYWDSTGSSWVGEVDLR